MYHISLFCDNCEKSSLQLFESQLDQCCIDFRGLPQMIVSFFQLDSPARPAKHVLHEHPPSSLTPDESKSTAVLSGKAHGLRHETFKIELVSTLGAFSLRWKVR